MIPSCCLRVPPGTGQPNKTSKNSCFKSQPDGWIRGGYLNLWEEAEARACNIRVCRSKLHLNQFERNAQFTKLIAKERNLRKASFSRGLAKIIEETLNTQFSKNPQKSALIIRDRRLEIVSDIRHLEVKLLSTHLSKVPRLAVLDCGTNTYVTKFPALSMQRLKYSQETSLIYQTPCWRAKLKCRKNFLYSWNYRFAKTWRKHGTDWDSIYHEEKVRKNDKNYLLQNDSDDSRSTSTWTRRRCNQFCLWRRHNKETPWAFSSCPSSV